MSTLQQEESQTQEESTKVTVVRSQHRKHVLCPSAAALASSNSTFCPMAEILIPDECSLVELQEVPEHSGIPCQACMRVQKRDCSFDQIFKAIGNQKPLRMTGLGIFSFILFPLTDTNANTPMPHTTSS